jgi:hypothetical protein
MFALAMQDFEVKCKKFDDLQPKQGNLLHRNNFEVVFKTSLHCKYCNF